jgi:hypothetical protein
MCSAWLWMMPVGQAVVAVDVAADAVASGSVVAIGVAVAVPVTTTKPPHIRKTTEATTSRV